jgi:hypothetical protein
MVECNCEITSFRTALHYICTGGKPLGNRARVAVMLTVAALTGAMK